MANLSKQSDYQNGKESIRVVISLGILATVLSVNIVLPNGIMLILKSTLCISGICSFLYILMTGSALKYRHQNEVGDLIFTEKFKNACFDHSIDAYGFSFTVTIALLYAYITGWRDYNNFDARVWTGFVISGATLLVINIISSILKRRGAESQIKR